MASRALGPQAVVQGWALADVCLELIELGRRPLTKGMKND